MGTAARRVNSVALAGSNDEPSSAPSGQLELTSLLFEVADDLGLQEKELAFALRYDAAYLSRIKKGEKPLPTARLTALPPNVRRELWKRAAEAEGLVVSPEDARQLAIGELLIAVGKVIRTFDQRLPKRMAKAQL